MQAGRGLDCGPGSWSRDFLLQPLPLWSSPTNQQSLYPDWGPQGQICTWLFPPKRGVCTFFFTCLPSMSSTAIQFVDFSQGAVVGTQCWDINPLSRLFLMLQREIKLRLITYLFSCVSIRIGKKWQFKADFLDESSVLLIGDLWIASKAQNFHKVQTSSHFSPRDKVCLR